jgi:hypothetical protein
MCALAEHVETVCIARLRLVLILVIHPDEVTDLSNVTTLNVFEICKGRQFCRRFSMLNIILWVLTPPEDSTLHSHPC